MENDQLPISPNVNPIDVLLPYIASAVIEWQQKNTAETIKKQVTRLLDQESKQITMKLLGFNATYGGQWEIDHCNGRSGESAAGDYIRKMQDVAIKEWLSKVKLPELDDKTQKNLTTSLKNTYTEALLRKTRELAYAQAEADAKVLIQKVVASNQIANYLAALKLICPQ